MKITITDGDDVRVFDGLERYDPDDRMAWAYLAGVVMAVLRNMVRAVRVRGGDVM